ncbi:winged helix-turn-helix transcriptional regulator [Paenibacillus agricola]|uniref:Helix-turn-helix transcriptional regulator n=1 Tax=Paenibacillus agricola TaxID=2716264 RepID=A0ABX0JDT4_9BACL|nr:helix-turn-helix domain-containing protein [Paenibacillus agricola]NHN33027.1 helix-turn-helix transcriptional regulator [Paenibacillus agricola]
MEAKHTLCLVNPALEVIAGKWKTTILLILLFEGTKRFSELNNAIPLITKKMLTSQLRELEDQDIILREVYPVVPPKVEYSLTEYGRTLEPILHLMHDWGSAHVSHMANKPNGRDFVEMM